MELRHLRHFLAVCEEGSMTRAAGRLFLAQPALSRQIRDLERHVGATLFLRTSKGVVLTEAGEQLRPHAVRLVHDFDAVLATSRAVARDRSDTRAADRLRVGLFLGLQSACELTIPILSAFRAALPNVALEVVDLAMTEPEPALLHERVDVALLRPPVDSSDIVLTPLFTEPRVVLLPAHHPVAEAPELRPADLHALRDATFVAQGALPRTFAGFFQLGDVWDVNDIRLTAPVPESGWQMVDMVQRGQAVLFSSASTARWYDPRAVVGIPILDVAGSVAAVAARADDDRPYVREFATSARRVAEQFIDLVPSARPIDGPPPAAATRSAVAGRA